nr:MAG TPA: hypothetical protein [Caudoviricetes sp.]
MPPIFVLFLFFILLFIIYCLYFKIPCIHTPTHSPHNYGTYMEIKMYLKSLDFTCF